MNDSIVGPSQERRGGGLNGWLVLCVHFLLLVAGILLFAHTLSTPAHNHGRIGWLVLALLVQLAVILMCGGYFALQLNEARVLILAGAYHGTVRRSGFFRANPFYSRNRTGPSLIGAVMAAQEAAKKRTPVAPPRGASTKISLRTRNFTSEKLKVNDKRGNPVEIAAVIVWRVEDTAKAVFDVDDFESYVQIQSESAIRHIASLFSYDRADDETDLTLRDSADEVAQSLQAELQLRLTNAGVVVEEARLTPI